jgi:hypothetical protein
VGTKCNKLIIVSEIQSSSHGSQPRSSISTQILAILPQIPPPDYPEHNNWYQAWLIWEEIFFLPQIIFALAPKKKPTKFQTEMATSMEDLKSTMESMAQQLAGVQDMAKQFSSLQEVVSTTLDKLQDLEAWRTVAETSMGSML